jgi:hypothetical protein
MTAITNKIWIIEPALKTKKPKSHPIIRITAAMYKRELIVLFIP